MKAIRVNFLECKQIINKARVFSNCLFIVFRFLYIHRLNYLNTIWGVKAQSLWGRVKIITNE